MKSLRRSGVSCASARLFSVSAEARRAPESRKSQIGYEVTGEADGDPLTGPRAAAGREWCTACDWNMRMPGSPAGGFRDFAVSGSCAVLFARRRQAVAEPSCRHAIKNRHRR